MLAYCSPYTTLKTCTDFFSMSWATVSQTFSHWECSSGNTAHVNHRSEVEGQLRVSIKLEKFGLEYSLIKKTEPCDIPECILLLQTARQTEVRINISSRSTSTRTEAALRRNIRAAADIPPLTHTVSHHITWLQKRSRCIVLHSLIHSIQVFKTAFK